MPAAPRVAALLALALLALAAHAPSVTGQGLPPAPAGGADAVQLTVESAGTLTPGQARTVNVTVRLCAASGSFLTGPKQLEVLAVEKPAFLDVRFEPATYTFAVLLPGSCEEARGTARFNVSTDAPAFEMVEAKIAARDKTGTGIQHVVAWHTRVGYHGDLRVTQEARRLHAPLGEPVPLRVWIENRGNAPTKFQLQIAGSRDDVKVVFPEPMVLAPGKRGEWTVLFVLPPESGRDARTIDLLVTSHAHMDHTAPGGSAVLTVEFAPEEGSPSARVRHFAPSIGDLTIFVVVAVVALGVAWWQARGGSRRS